MDGMGQKGTSKCWTQQSTDPIMSAPPSEDNSGFDALNVGLGSVVPRWAPNTSLRYFVERQDFPSAGDATYASQAFQEAADEWTVLGIGISFAETAQQNNSHFSLVYQPNTDSEKGRLAEAFFPHQRNAKMIVTDFGLSPAERPALKNNILHEVGHILGLRHEFAVAREQHLAAAVEFMQENPNSVMNYTGEPGNSTAMPTMQQSDKDGIRAFYNLPAGHMIHGIPVTDYQPVLWTP